MHGSQEFAALQARLSSAERVGRITGAGPLRRRSVSAGLGSVMLVGDAAGYVDALTGEGLSVGFQFCGGCGDGRHHWRRPRLPKGVAQSHQAESAVDRASAAWDASSAATYVNAHDEWGGTSNIRCHRSLGRVTISSTQRLPSSFGCQEAGSAFLIEPLDLNESEPSPFDEVADLSGQVASTGYPLLDWLETVLPALNFEVRR